MNLFSECFFLRKPTRGLFSNRTPAADFACFFSPVILLMVQKSGSPVDMVNICRYPISYKVLYIPTGCLDGISATKRPNLQAPEHVLKSAGVTLGPEARKGRSFRTRRCKWLGRAVKLAPQNCNNNNNNNKKQKNKRKKSNGGFKHVLTSLFGILYFFVWGRKSIVRFFF